VAVAQLEGLTKTRRSARLQILHNSGDNNSFWWTICCVHWESFLIAALLVMIKMLLPQEFDDISILDLMDDNPALVDHIVNISYYIAIALVAPFYVAGGFIAYLNRRMMLEGWDIEIGFKTWLKDQFQHADNSADKNKPLSSQKHNNSTKQIMSIVIVSSFMLGLQFGASQSAFAIGASIEGPAQSQSEDETIGELPTTEQISEQDTSVFGNSEISEGAAGNAVIEPDLKNQALRDTIADDIENVLNNEPFGSKDTVTRYRLRQGEDDDEDEEVTNTNNAFVKFLGLIAKFLASSIQFIFWILLAFIVLYLIYRNRQLIANLFTSDEAQNNDVTLPSFISKAFTEKLPDDVTASVKQAIEDEDYRRALSILVRASLTKLSQQDKVRITKGMTENECLAELKMTIPQDIYLFMVSLMQAWMKMAWAHQLPNTQTLIDLNENYHLYFVQQADGTES
jgi:Arc/MetJ-type ribon-helix-helix transcriptional regulator